MPEELMTQVVPSRTDENIYQDIVRKIRLQRGIHRYFELRTRFTATLVKVINIVLPAHIVFLVFSDLTSLTGYVAWLTPMRVELLIGGAGFILFVTSVLTEVFKGDQRHTEHRRAIERYTELLQEVELMDFRGKSAKMRGESFQNLHKRYLQTTVTSPTFTDKQFDRAMGYLLRSKAIKMARKEQPFASPWKIRRLAKRKVNDILQDPTDPLYGFPYRARRPEEESAHAGEPVQQFIG